MFFGILGDRIGRVKTMVWTILCYTLFTGLSMLATGIWDFNAYRFLCGLGVGGQFAVGVALVAEVVPERARPYALGTLQSFAAVGNMFAATRRDSARTRWSERAPFMERGAGSFSPARCPRRSLSWSSVS